MHFSECTPSCFIVFGKFLCILQQVHKNVCKNRDHARSIALLKMKIGCELTKLPGWSSFFEKKRTDYVLRI